MKVSTPILAASVFANIVLAAMILRTPAVEEAGIQVVSPGVAASAPSTAAATEAATARAVGAFFGGDLKDVVARMRSAGFSDSVVRAVATYALREQFRAWYEAIAKTLSFTDTNATVENLRADPEYRALDLEFNQALRELVGYTRIERNPGDLKSYYGNLDPRKIDQIEANVGKYVDLRGDTAGLPTRERQEALERLRQEQRAEMVALLTPDELAEVDLRASNTAFSLRTRLSSFAPTEDEFRTVLNLQKAFDDEFSVANLSTPTRGNQRAIAQEKLEQDIAVALGPERGAEYRIKGNPEYTTTSAFVARMRLPESSTTELIQIQNESAARMSKFREEFGFPSNVGPNPTRDQIAAMQARNQRSFATLAAIKAETEQRLGKLLGERGFEIFRSNTVGRWYVFTFPSQAQGAPRGP